MKNYLFMKLYFFLSLLTYIYTIYRQETYKIFDNFYLIDTVIYGITILVKSI